MPIGIYKHKRRHGFFGTRFYGIFYKMQYRCSKKHPKKKYYFDKGIKVSKRWLKFKNFLIDMYPSYLEHCKRFGEKQTTIDRIDGKKGYLKNNCRWATYIEQNINRKSKL